MIEKLEFFIVLSKEKHFGKAAQKIGITQPTLSAAIQSLEDNLGVLLIRRGTRYQELTVEGQRVLDWAKKICSDTKIMKEEMKLLKKGLAGSLKIGIIPSVEPLLPQITNKFLKKNPNVNFEIYSKSSNEILNELIQFEIDVGFTYIEENKIEKLMYIPIFLESYFLITHKNLNIDKTKVLNWNEIKKLNICLLTKNMSKRRILDYNLSKQGIYLEPKLEADSLLTLLSHVNSGEWASIFPLALKKLVDTNKDIISIPISKPKITKSIGMITLKKEPNTPLVSAILNDIKKLNNLNFNN